VRLVARRQTCDLGSSPDRTACRARVSPSSGRSGSRRVIAYARGEWNDAAKVYVTNLSSGGFPRDARARAATRCSVGDVVPANPRRGLPTVSGVVSSRTPRPGCQAVLDAQRTGAPDRGGSRARAETAGRPDASRAAVVGAGVNGRALRDLPRARPRSLWTSTRRERAARRTSWVRRRLSRDEALSADLLATVTRATSAARRRVARPRQT